MPQLTRNYFSIMRKVKISTPLNISYCSFMKRDVKRIVGFCEVLVPSYAIAEFRSHFRMNKTTFEVLAREFAACTPENRTLNSSHVDASHVTEIQIGIWPGTGFEWQMVSAYFRSDIPLGNFGLPFKTFRLF